MMITSGSVALAQALHSNQPNRVLASSKNFNPNTCSWGQFSLYGKVQVVESFPDLKVQVVSSFPDLKVQTVESFPDGCGKWQFVESFPDFKIQFVSSFPDVKIQFVTSFPGVR